MSAVNPSVLQELRGLQGSGTPDLLAELIDLFLREGGGRLARLREALLAQDAPLFERGAHALKTSCGNLGAQAMSKMCSDLKGLARSGSWESATALLAGVESEFVAVREELEAERRKSA